MDKKSRELVMAKLYFKNKDYKMAEMSFNQYLSMVPDDVSALKLLAQVYEQTKRFDKAFEMYERCYLAEPDRTGVLLDICRLLLMNDIWLDHVDYRKWLNLAIKAFPSNPIVVNLKSFLSTLPANDISNSQPEIPSTKTHEDSLSKILEKLSLIETRLVNIEQKMSASPQPQPVHTSSTFLNVKDKESKEDNIKTTSIAKLPIEKPQVATPPVEKTPVVKTPVVQTPVVQTPVLQTPVVQTPVVQTPVVKTPVLQTPVEKPSIEKPPVIAAPVFTPIFGNLSEPKEAAASGSTQQTSSLFSANPSFNFSGNLFSDSMKKFNIPTQSPFSMGFPSPSLKPQEQKENGDGNGVVPKEEVRIQNNSDTKEVVAQEANQQSSSLFPAAPSFSFSGNLFANSMKKFDIPTQSPFSMGFSSPSIKPQEPEENDDDNGVVPNEELPIENNCDMKEIEIKTGEEDEELLFEHRCKLYRLKDKEYKERGLGSIKVLKHRSTGKIRFIMRRDAIGLVCLNCWECHNIERVKENQVRWFGIDASDGEPEPTCFLAKFKTSDVTDTFIKYANYENPDVELVDPKLDQNLVEKARKLQLPDLFYHKIKNQDSCEGCDGCEKDE